MNTDLYQYMLKNSRPLPDIQIKIYFYQLLNGLEFCHRNQSLFILQIIFLNSSFF